nr:MAG TPA: hypothetical protein [Caudoviricetes sp.]
MRFASFVLFLCHFTMTSLCLIIKFLTLTK